MFYFKYYIYSLRGEGGHVCAHMHMHVRVQVKGQFVGISSCLLPYKIRELKSEINMRVTALLDNGERIQINRSYKAKFNAFLNAVNQGGVQDETNS